MLTLNPTYLQTFKVLAETKHFTKTAQQRHMTQPGVSQHLKKLEQTLGYTLIDREVSPFRLTEQGRLLYDYICTVTQSQERLLDQMGFDDTYSGVCRIACSGAIALKIYPELLSLQQQHSELHFELEAAPHYRIIEGLINDDYDVGLTTHQPSSKLVDSQIIGQEKISLVIATHLWQTYQHNPPPLIEVLKQTGLIQHPDLMHYLNLFCANCGEISLNQEYGSSHGSSVINNNSPSNNSSIHSQKLSELPATGYINQISQILLPVSLGLGVSVVPHNVLTTSPYKEALTAISTPNSVTEPVYLLHSYGRVLPKRFEQIIVQCHSALS